MSNALRPELGAAIRGHIELELDSDGRRALDFLDQAFAILSRRDIGPKGAETVAYCLREAMASVVRNVPKNTSWRAATKKVVYAWKGYRGSLPGPSERSARVLMDETVLELEELERMQSFHEQQMERMIRARTGEVPIPQAGVSKQYGKLMRRLNRGVHEETERAAVERLWAEIIGLLFRVFTPPAIRHSELETIASIVSPTDDDAVRVKQALLTSHHRRHFLTHVEDPAWLARLTAADLIGRSDVHIVANTVGKRHPAEVISWLTAIYQSSPGTAAEALTIAQASAGIGGAAMPLLHRIARRHPDAPWISLFVASALRDIPAEAPAVEDVAAVLLVRLVDPTARFGSGAQYHQLRSIIEHLVHGSNAETASRRYALLCRVLQRLRPDDLAVRYIVADGKAISPTEAVDWDDFDYPVEMLIRGWAMVAFRAREWMSVDDLLTGVERIPSALSQMLQAWLLRIGLDDNERRAVQHIAIGIRERFPSDDDRLLVQRLREDAEGEPAWSAWKESLGSVPSIQTLSDALRRKSPDVAWLRARAWASHLPDTVTGPWRNAIALMDSHYGPATGDPLRVPSGTIGYVDSPMSREDLMGRSAIDACQRIAAWRPASNQFDVNARALGQTLEEVIVSAEDDRWIRSPVQVVCALRQPTYIAHYVTGLTRVLRDRALPEAASELLDVVQLVENPAWNIVALGQPEFDFDADWKCAKDVTIDLLKMMAHSDTGFAGREREAWDLLDKHVRSSEEPGEFYGDDARDLVTAAINWRRTRALEAAIAFVRWERRDGREIREEARNLLAYAIGLGGRVGLLCRAIIAFNLHVLEYVCPGWLADNMSRLFEDDSPGNLSDKTLELALEWARAPALRQVLEAYPQKVAEASVAGDRQAFVRYVGAMIHGVSGYSAEGVFECVRKNGTPADSLGSVLRDLLPSDAEDAVVESVLDFWRRSIHDGPTAMLPQFGWLAVVDRIGGEIWTVHTLETLQKTRGRVAGQIKKKRYVAERAAGLTPSREALRIMDLLVRDSAPLDDVLVFPAARKLMEKSRDLADSDEYRRLKAALAERGARE